MEPAVLRRIFEPFFTTKSVGRGTGLGLVMVQGIVKESGGHIAVESKPAQGSAFRIYLPRVLGGAAAILPGLVSRTSRGGHETILVVDDNATLRALIKKALRRKGYQVFSAANAEDALRLCRRLKEGVDLLFTDLSLPEQNGVELATQLVKMKPGLKVIFMSGYAGAIVSLANASRQTVILDKPFSPERMLGALRQVLDA
jgi:CheY-like chemotaxis protein